MSKKTQDIKKKFRRLAIFSSENHCVHSFLTKKKRNQYSTKEIRNIKNPTHHKKPLLIAQAKIIKKKW